LDQDHSGKIEFIEFENLLLLSRCCEMLLHHRLLAHKATIACADLTIADAHADLRPKTYELSNKQQCLLEEVVVCQARMRANAHASTDAYLNHLNQAFRIFGCCESQRLDEIALFVDVVHFGAMALGATAWVGVAFNLVFCFEVTIRIHSMQSLALFLEDPRGRGDAMQNKVNFGCTVLGMFGSTLVILEEFGAHTNQERLWRFIQLAPLLRIFVISAQFRHIMRALLSGLKRIRPFVTLFLIVFYTFSECAHYLLKDLDIKRGGTFSEQLNFSTFGDSCLAMFQIFVGAGWSVVMSAAVEETSRTYNWFFLFYRFVVGVLFAELIVGILIATFGEASSLDTSAAGEEVLHEFKSQLEVLSHAEQVAFVKGLGVPAQFSLDAASDANADLTLRSVDVHTTAGLEITSTSGTPRGIPSA